MTVDPRDLARRFEEKWGMSPSHVVRAPGRVNLIGEHIDYCGLPVLPMAIDRGVWLAFRATGREEVRIATTAPELSERRFSTVGPIEPGPPGDWANYARAAVAAIDDAAERGILGLAPRADSSLAGFDALVDADLPIASGLSSSSALVIAAALAVLEVAGVRLAPDGDGLTDPESVAIRLRLAALLAAGERYVGTAGGGMDQAACLLGVAGCAIRVAFSPLDVRPIPIPGDWRIVIADSGERAEKSGSAQQVYNARTEEAREAARLVWDALGEPERFEAGADTGLGSHRDLIDREIGPEILTSLDPTLARRFSHIRSEAARVRDAEAALLAGDLDGFGRLLIASHESLRNLYEVSTGRLDRLVERALGSGAAGARLTGAGLGGSIVAVCTASRAEAVLEGLRAASPFVAVPSDGAAVHPVEGD